MAFLEVSGIYKAFGKTEVLKGIDFSLEKGHTSYTSNLGMLPLRRAICDYLCSDYDLDYNPETQCLITVGVSEALDLAVRAVLCPGDEAIYASPCYVSYPAEIQMTGGIPVPLPTYRKDNFAVDPGELRKLITPRTKLLMLNFPCNPTGAVMGRAALEEVAKIARKYDLLSVPVVDNENRLGGIITIDDIIDVMDDAATEDIEKMHMLLPSEDDYLKTGIFTLVKNRIVWLLILMIASTFTSQIITGFEDKLAAIAGLTASIPMLTGTGGNAGNQVSSLIIRGIALGKIEIKDFFRVLWMRRCIPLYA